MDWKTLYRNRAISADKALDEVKSNNRIVFGHAAGEPRHLVETLISKKEQYSNVEIVHMVSLGSADYAKPGMENHFRHNALFVGGGTRKAVEEGRADFTPCFFHEVPRFFEDGSLPVDVSLIQVTPPDENGDVSLGVSVDYTIGAARNAKKIIAQVNSMMPRTGGESKLHVSEIDYFVEYDEPIFELKPPAIGEVEIAIGENCARLINDGDTLQLGIGAIPDAVLLFLKDKKDLGIHSEMISDGVLELVKEGVITNQCKSIHKGKIVVTFLMGTQKLYDYVDNNPDVELYPVDYVNNPVTVMKNDNIVAINSCVQIDLMGQVASESVGLKQISGTGGQVDFVRGVSMARGGRAIMAMPSTAAKGTVSKIVPFLDEGAAITTLRTDVDYVVTEYGIASLKGKNLRERARQLISITHPNFRDELIEIFKERFKAEY